METLGGNTNVNVSFGPGFVTFVNRDEPDPDALFTIFKNLAFTAVRSTDGIPLA